jgi:hypothetical protein
MQVTEGPHEGKIAVLDFGLVAEVPIEDREAMVSAVIHLANRDWWGTPLSRFCLATPCLPPAYDTLLAFGPRGSCVVMTL